MQMNKEQAQKKITKQDEEKLKEKILREKGLTIKYKT